MKIAALIVAAGRGLRAGAGVPKQYAMIGGKPLIRWSIDRFAELDEINSIQVVTHTSDDALYWSSVGRTNGTEWECTLAQAQKLRIPAKGQTTRQASVRAGLMALSCDPPGVPYTPPDLVLIHDAARPFVETSVIQDIIAALGTHQGAIAAVQLSDTLKRAGPDGLITGTVERSGLWRAQTPQGFRFDAILKAHLDAEKQGKTDFTDDAALAEWAGLDVALVTGRNANFKLTNREDFGMAEALLAAGSQFETRTGTGFDVHKFCDGDHVWLGGVKILHTHSLEGHSDADVVLHALTDALLGAIGDGDIGQHFPPSDPQWKGAASKIFVEDAVRRVRERGGKIVNVDVTVLAEAPKIGPHRQAIQFAIAAALGLTPDRIGVKATTTEGLGFTGRREGIAAMTSATVMLPIPVAP